MWSAILRWSLLIAAIASFIGAIFFLGSHMKDVEWQAKWNKAEVERQEAIDAVKTEYRTKEEAHAVEASRLQTQIADQARLHQVALAAVRAELDKRVRSSEQRALVYQRQAEADPAQCRDLADHAARLDGSLEQGRSLVQELRLTLGQRDNEIRSLSQQINADRQLFE